MSRRVLQQLELEDLPSAIVTMVVVVVVVIATAMLTYLVCVCARAVTTCREGTLRAASTALLPSSGTAAPGGTSRTIGVDVLSTKWSIS